MYYNNNTPSLNSLALQTSIQGKYLSMPEVVNITRCSRRERRNAYQSSDDIPFTYLNILYINSKTMFLDLPSMMDGSICTHFLLP
jgi:hypothetical protein